MVTINYLTHSHLHHYHSLQKKRPEDLIVLSLLITKYQREKVSNQLKKQIFPLQLGGDQSRAPNECQCCSMSAGCVLIVVLFTMHTQKGENMSVLCVQLVRKWSILTLPFQSFSHLLAAVQSADCSSVFGSKPFIQIYTLGAIWDSVSCPRTLEHADRRRRGSNPNQYHMYNNTIHPLLWQQVQQCIPTLLGGPKASPGQMDYGLYTSKGRCPGSDPNHLDTKERWLYSKLPLDVQAHYSISIL